MDPSVLNLSQRKLYCDVMHGLGNWSRPPQYCPSSVEFSLWPSRICTQNICIRPCQISISLPTMTPTTERDAYPMLSLLSYPCLASAAVFMDDSFLMSGLHGMTLNWLTIGTTLTLPSPVLMSSSQYHCSRWGVMFSRIWFLVCSQPCSEPINIAPSTYPSICTYKTTQ
jgi:hypothetical protein